MTRPRSPANPRPTTRTPLLWLTHAAFVVAIAIIIARLTTPDALRDPWGPSPDAAPTASGPGATTSLVFDLLAMLPAVLIWIRSALDREFVLVRRASHPLLFALSGFAMLSTFWASDRFLALVTASHFFSACCLLWAMSQLVRSSVRFRVVSAVTLGLLLVMVTQSMLYRFVEVPANVSYWNEKKADILKARGWAPESFPARQFEHKLTSGEPIGFFNSPNSVAAVAVLLFAACAGIGFQKVKDGEEKQWMVLSVVAAASLVWILIDARSKTSAATPFIGLAILCAFIVFRDRLIQHHDRSFFIVSAFVGLFILAVIGHGLYHHGLFAGHFSNSLDFRWKYWTASMGIFRTHPLVGVGWSNFGLSYLAHRLPEAAEEIKDPHNFLIKFLTELGLSGMIICIAWLMRTAWEITRPGPDKSPSNNEIECTIRSVIFAVLVGMVLNVAANVDFLLSAVDTITLLLKPLLFLLALMLGTLAGSMRSPHEWKLDTRPPGWIFHPFVIGLGLFLLHNLIDFSWFEPGALFCFLALVGSALGIADEQPSRGWSAWWTRLFASLAGLGWLSFLGFLVLPVLFAEQLAQAGDQSIQTASAQNSTDTLTHYRIAADDYFKAAQLVPYNSDYVFRQAQATLNTGNYIETRKLLAKVQQMNPLQIDAYLLDAHVALATPGTNQSTVRADFETAIALNPNDVNIHVEYAHALEHFQDVSAARRQYEQALAANAALPTAEPKRLSDQQVAQLEAAAGRGSQH